MVEGHQHAPFSVERDARLWGFLRVGDQPLEWTQYEMLDVLCRRWHVTPGMLLAEDAEDVLRTLYYAGLSAEYETGGAPPTDDEIAEGLGG